MHECHELRKIRQLVVAACNQDDVPDECFKCLDRRVCIRRLRVVVISDIVHGAHKLDTVLHTLERTQHGTHLGRCHPRKERHRRRRERILDVVRPLDAKFRRRHERDLLAALTQDELVA